MISYLLLTSMTEGALSNHVMSIKVQAYIIILVFILSGQGAKGNI